MISKRFRNSTGATENLKQGGFTGVKGIDVNGSILSTDTVLQTKNLDVNLDGSLSLRKPVICVSEIPEVKFKTGSISTDLTCYKRLFDKDYVLVIRTAPDGKQYIGIFKDGVPQTIRVQYTSWTDYTLYTLEPTPSEDVVNGFYTLEYLDCKNISFTNTATSAVFTNVFVDIANRAFVREGVEYPDEHSTDLFYSTLYDYDTESSTISLYKPRTVTLTKSTSYNFNFDLNINTPEISYIQPSDTLRLDVNLDLDNPYSIRDAYRSTAPSVKNIIAYVPTFTQNNHSVVSPEDVSDLSEIVTAYTGVTNPHRIPEALDLNNLDFSHIYIFSNTKKQQIDIRTFFTPWNAVWSNTTMCSNVVGLLYTECLGHMFLRIHYHDSEGMYRYVDVRIRIGIVEGDGGMPEKGIITDYEDTYTDRANLWYYTEVDHTFTYSIDYKEEVSGTLPYDLRIVINNLPGDYVASVCWHTLQYTIQGIERPWEFNTDPLNNLTHTTTVDTVEYLTPRTWNGCEVYPYFHLSLFYEAPVKSGDLYTYKTIARSFSVLSNREL